MKLTREFPGKVRPARKGVYQRQYTFAAGRRWEYCYWNGARWYSWALTPYAAFHGMLMVSPSQKLPWRGLRKELTA